MILPDSSIGVYSNEKFDEDHNICGIESVVIVELKRGGFELTFEEKDQATAYCREIRKSGRVDPSTKITCYVLGSTFSQDGELSEPTRTGNTTIIPRRFSTILAQAKARTFNLLKKLERFEENKEEVSDDNTLF